MSAAALLRDIGFILAAGGLFVVLLGFLVVAGAVIHLLWLFFTLGWAIVPR